MMYKYGIVVIGYKNALGVKRLLDALNNAAYGKEEILLIISIDNSGENYVENVAAAFEWKYGKKVVRTFPKRLGLREHIITCGDYLDEYELDALVVFEDDMMPSKYYFDYVRETAEKYIDDTNIAGISLYSYPENHEYETFMPIIDNNSDIYFFQCAQSRGQIWLKKQWSEFRDWYNNNRDYKKWDCLSKYVSWPESSWLKYHNEYCRVKNKFFVHPYISVSTCFGEVGEHVLNERNDFQVQFSLGRKDKYMLPDFNSSAIYYDTYFESMNIYEYLGIDKEDLLVDLYGEHIVADRRYLLSCHRYNYRIIKKWGNKMIPHEMNIIYGVDGNDFFLYEISSDDNTNLQATVYCGDIHNKFFLYGSGIIGKQWLKKIGDGNVFGFIDSDEKKSGTYIYRKRIYSLREILSMNESVRIFISTNEKNKCEIMKMLEIRGLEKYVINSI